MATKKDKEKALTTEDLPENLGGRDVEQTEDKVSQNDDLPGVQGNQVTEEDRENQQLRANRGVRYNADGTVETEEQKREREEREAKLREEE